jgi:hypothetical protein
MRPAHIKEQRDKEVRQLWKERRTLRKEIYNLPYIKLDKPLRHGWYKEIVLTENLDRYKNKKAIEEIFKMLDTFYWGRTKKECEENWNNQRSKHFIFRDVPTISKKQFNRLSEKSKRLCTPFQYREYRKIKTRFYIRMPKNAYRIRYTRAYITHFQVHDPNLHSRDAFLEQRLLSPGFYELNEYRYRDKWSTKETKKSRVKIKQELGRYKNASYRSLRIELWERN